MTSINQKITKVLAQEFIEGTIYRIDLDRVDVAPDGSSGILRSLPLTGDRDKIKPGDTVKIITIAGERVVLAGDVALMDSSEAIVEDASEVELAENMLKVGSSSVGGASSSTITAADIASNTSAFNGLLTTTENTIQKALDKLDDHTHAAPSASAISVVTTAFNKNLTSAENTVQKALDKLDDLTVTATADWSTITNKPATFTPSAHNQDWSTITGKPAVVITNANGDLVMPANTHIYGDQAIGCHVYRGADQLSFPRMAWTPVTFGGTRWDYRPAGAAAHWDGATAIYCRVDGLYYIYGNLAFASYAGNTRGACITINSNTQVAMVLENALTASYSHVINVSCIRFLSAGHYVQLCGWQDTPGTLTLTYLASHSPELAMVRVG